MYHYKKTLNDGIDYNYHSFRNVNSENYKDAVLKLIDDKGIIVSEIKTDKDGLYKFDDAINCSNNYEIQVNKEPAIIQITLKL